MYEVEHWLDEMAFDAGYYFERLAGIYVDERRRFYKRDREKIDIFISNTLFPLPQRHPALKIRLPSAPSLGRAAPGRPA